MSFFTLSLSGFNWSHHHGPEQLAVKGRIYLDKQPITADDLVRHLATATTALAVSSALERLNGFYAWVRQSGTTLLAGVDHVRSWPLFYGQADGLLYLSDSAEWVRQQVGDTSIAQMAREEFLLAGYVTGRETLYPNVKQLQAGEYLEARARDGVVEVTTQRYFRFWHIEPVAYDEVALRQGLEEATRNAIRRLTEFAAGRQVVVPLSGGYDSRLIVTMLKELVYDNVLCFSYGVPGNKEAQYSREVAKALQYEWVFVEYSASLWRQAWRSPEAEIYRRRSSNHVSLPHVQDWLAVKQLLEQKAIGSNAIIVPGHTGDFVAGGHIPAFVFKHRRHTENAILESLVENHLSNMPKAGMALAEVDALHGRLRDRIDSAFDGSSVEAANLYELWDWQERQSKYIVNSVRVYDHFGLEWWLPLWDLDFVRIWETVPLQLRQERAWYKKWVNGQYTRNCTISGDTGSLGSATERSFFFQKVFNFARILPCSIREPLRRAWQIKKNTSHLLAFEGLVTVGDLKRYMSRGYNIIGIYSELYFTNQW